MASKWAGSIALAMRVISDSHTSSVNSSGSTSLTASTDGVERGEVGGEGRVEPLRLESGDAAPRLVVMLPDACAIAIIRVTSAIWTTPDPCTSIVLKIFRSSVSLLSNDILGDAPRFEE